MSPALRLLAAPLLALAFTMNTPAQTPAPDPHLWLEDVSGEAALNWVKQRNAASRPVLEAHPDFASNRTRLKAIMDSKERIPMASRRGEHFYNFWQDAEHPRGLWRRTPLASYASAQPAWELLLDLDALGRAENENWVWKGAQCLGGRSTRCLLQLSRGGADATVVREFDLATRRFVDDGFRLPEAKSSVAWLDEQQVLVGTDTGPGSLTDSGYPRVMWLWKRGQPLSQAQRVFEAQPSDVAADAIVDRTPGFERVLFQRAIDFYRSELFLWERGALQRLDKPADADLSFWKDRVLLRLRSDWTVAGQRWPSGSLLVADAAAYLGGQRSFTALFTPTSTRSLSGYSTTRSRVLIDVLDNVAGRAEAWTPGPGGWTRREIQAPFPGTLSTRSLHDPLVADDALAEGFFADYTDFLTPDTLYQGDAGGGPLQALKARPSFFDAAGMRVEQRFATSKDGTRVPYFIVWPRGAQADGQRPTLLYGYGGFEVSMNPWYSGGFGTTWYGKGGVLVVANIRGGGEFGPTWHQAAVREGKQKSFDDFIAVAEDLVATKVTSPRHLGIMGGSNGGLLMGAVMVQRPDLFNAVVCQVPLLDMRRYHTLLAGASWMAEYGDPDKPEDWAFISRYSPYQNVKAGVKMPKVLFVTSTRDDRVHPGHARKMAARMIEQGHQVLYYENIEGGHGAGADNAQHADRMALEFAFLWQQLGAQQ